MRKLISTILAKAGSFLISLSRKAYLSPFQKQKNAFKKVVGDSTNFECDLNENSIVFDVGGYEGQWASDIYSKFNCHIHVFEPVTSFADAIQKRFARNQNINVHPFGLSDSTRKETIFLQKDGSSTIKKNGQPENTQMRSVLEFIHENNITKIDFIKINIEGGEYALLASLLDSGFIKNVGCLLIQFHDFFPNASAKMEEIRNRLDVTHKTVYQFNFVWELWKLK